MVVVMIALCLITLHVAPPRVPLVDLTLGSEPVEHVENPDTSLQTVRTTSVTAPPHNSPQQPASYLEKLEMPFVVRDTRWNSISAVPISIDEHTKNISVPIEPIDIRLPGSSRRATNAAVLRGIRPLISSSYYKPGEPLYEQRASGQRLWIDVGARSFVKGSTWWFISHYPQRETFGAVAFELLDLAHEYTTAGLYFKRFSYERAAAWTHNRGVVIKGFKMATVKENTNELPGDTRAEWTAPSVDLAQYLKNRTTVRDFVVMKMDIELGEWTVIPHLIRTGALELVDELFLECHGPQMEAKPKRLPPICVDLINDLRLRGVYCHHWV